MFVWRVIRKAHAEQPLSGEGARRFGGRWNHQGVPVVYTSQSLSLAALEYLVNLSMLDLRRDLVTIRIKIPDALVQTEVRINSLPRNWRAFPGPEILKDIGQEWVENGEAPILVVPSVVIPGERNFLINPTHPLAHKVLVDQVEPFPLDKRLRGGGKSARAKKSTRRP